MSESLMKVPEKEIKLFNSQGYIIYEKFIDESLVVEVRNRFEKIFRGEFATTVPPDEWRWAEGRDPNNVTRMIWNGWKSDLSIAKLALHAKIGAYCAQLMGWTGTRLNQDGCIWKPPGSKGLEYHQDGNYVGWINPHTMVTCWVALDDARADSGTLEYVPGSHLWGAGEKAASFHSPDDHRAIAKEAAKQSKQEFKYVSVEIPPGGAAFHHPWTWHGSGPNTGPNNRRALAVHCMPELARFDASSPGYAQGRYRKFGDTSMEESFYPIIWSQSGYRSWFIKDYINRTGVEYKSHTFNKK